MRSEGAIFIICGSFKEIRCSKTDVNILLYVLDKCSSKSWDWNITQKNKTWTVHDPI